LVQARVYTHFCRIVFWTIPCLLLAILVTGCGGGGTHLSTTAEPTITLSASPSSISAGASSTLTSTATNATTVTITGSDGSSYNLTATGGTQAVTPTTTTTYTATAVGDGGKNTATATVTVAATPPPAPTVTIAASPTTIAAGGSSTLTVAATNATQVTISGSDGTSYSLAATGGTQSVTPAATTTYTATATGAGGTITATATVTVAASSTPAPTVTINANPTAVTAGTSSLLSVTATNATGVTITGTDGSSYTLTATGGTQSVTPKTTTTYTATAVGPGGKTAATATVTVSANPVPTVTIVAAPPSITAGSSSSLTVTADYATTVTLTGSDGSSYPTNMTPTGGLQSVSPAANTTYTATATGPGGITTATAVVTVTLNPAPTVTITANPSTIVSGSASTLTVAATNAATVTIAGTDNSSYSLPAAGGTQAVTPTATTSYTVTATGPGGSVTAATTVTVNPPGSTLQINHVIFELQENHSFDNYFGMLNPYRAKNGFSVGDDGVTYTVDGIDDKLSKFANPDDPTVNGGNSIHLFKLTSTCLDDMSSDWLSSYGDVDRYHFDTARAISMDGFVHNASGYATSCANSGKCSGVFTDTDGERSMGYYDENFLNYYYYMASQFAVSDRWFSPMSDKSIDNRIATFTGGTTQGLVLDPGGQDKLNQLAINNIFEELDKAGVSWKIYYTVTQGFCLESSTDEECIPKGSTTATAYNNMPATDFGTISYSFNYLYIPTTPGTCTGTTVPSSVWGDTANTYCVDPTRIAPLTQYYKDLENGTLPSFAFIEAGYANNDEHPGSGQSVLNGQAEVANVVNALMKSTSWSDSVFFFSYDEGGGPFDHVPPVPGHTNDNTDAAAKANYPTDISKIAVNADSYYPCVPPAVVGTDGTTTYPATTHCDLPSGWPGAATTDDPAVNGFAAQLGFRLPNIVISPFTRKHYVSHVPMDHTAVIKFVENRFIKGSPSLTPHDAAQPDLTDFFDFNNIPWSTPPTNLPTPVSQSSLGYNPCTPETFGQLYPQ